jgi:hypothetical protein
MSTEQTPKIEWKWIKEENQFGSYPGVNVHVFRELTWDDYVRKEKFVWGYILEPATKTKPWRTDLDVSGHASTREEVVSIVEVLAERFARAFKILSEPL